MTLPSRVGHTLADSTPFWPDPPAPPPGSPNVLVLLLDDVGFADFGCYGSEIRTPNIDRFADSGTRFTGFHTTAMCSTTRAALLTGRNHHSVGVGCLANFDSGFPGYRGKISADAPTIAEMLRPHGYRNYMVGKWHATSTTETGPTGPFDGWPLRRGFDRFYGFLDAETDQYSPELVQDNAHITPPGTYETGYHLTADLVDHAIEYVKSHEAAIPDLPWFMLLAPGACHAPHQAPKELIDSYEPLFAKGWDQSRADRLAKQIEFGVVPAGTALPARNDFVMAWADHSAEDRRVFTRLQAAYAAMLEHTDTHFGRLASHLDQAGVLDDTIVIILSDNGASQEGGPHGFVNAMSVFAGIPEPMDDKLARLDDIGGPDSHSNFPWGWAMNANTPLKRYKQNTHGGGIRDPLIVSWPAKFDDAGSLRHQFCHVSDLAPTLLDIVGIAPANDLEGTSFAASLVDADAPAAKHVQYFEMFGHRGIWIDGWKAVAYHPSGQPFDADEWELYDLGSDFNECHDRSSDEPERLASMIERWWEQAEAHQVLPLDDRFAQRFAENAERFTGDRRHYTFWRGMGHLPSDVAPDLRSRSYLINAHVDFGAGDEGVLIAHGDATSGYSLFVRDGHLVHDLNIGGTHQIVESDRPVPEGTTTLGFRMQRQPAQPERGPTGVGTLLIDGEPAGAMATANAFAVTISWSGLDVGYDRGTTVQSYRNDGSLNDPFEFTGTLTKVTVDLDDDQELDHGRAADAAVSRG